MKENIVHLMPAPLIRFLARPYVSGYSISNGITRAEQLCLQNRLSTIDLLGEEARNPKDISDSVQVYLKLIDTIAANSNFADHAIRPTVSLKPSALVVTNIVDDTLQIDEDGLENNIRTILERAREHKVEITIDMEDYHWTDLTLRLYKHFFTSGFPTCGTVMQSRLFRTGDDLEKLPEGSRVRLCIGIYKEDSSRALTEKREMKEKLLQFAEVMLRKNMFLELATHDEEFLQRFFKEVLPKYDFPKNRLEVQMLLGVPRTEIQKQIQAGELTGGKPIPVRLYVPFAVNRKDATHYSKRRLIANPDIITYGVKNVLGRLLGKGMA